ncbi:MAG TPA: DUF262 domain-containing protein [Bacteroidales bacterium]|nr:DUF262 domain-containing protein [Bacteroidales bacterium]
MTDKNLKELEEIQQYEDSSNELPPNDIVAFNELRSCADLLRLYKTKQLEIQPDFQRDIVWSKPDQTRFIDSLTKQLPIPSMCISLDYKTDKRLVIDGLQRMNSIINFLSDDEWKLSELDDIDEKLAGKTVHTIKTKSKDLFDRVQNVMIPVTVIRCDYSKPTHNEYLFTIFHRLNSGGVKLNNQEIRNCIYNGTLNSLLKTLAKSTETKKLFGLKSRFANEEMILRFYAFNERLNDYNGKLSKFLNNYMFDNRNIDEQTQNIKRGLYSPTTNLVYEIIFDKTSATSLGKTFLEGLLFGVSQNLEKLKNETPQRVKQLYETFKELPEYSVQSLKEGLSAREKVVDRLTASKNCFAQ